jgi:hypothetical protein
MRFEISLVDAPATPRRDIAVIGLYRVLFEATVASEVTGVFAEDAFVEVLEGGVAIGVVGGDSGPVIGAAVASGPLGEPLEFASGVSSVVPTVPTAAFPFVLEVALERLGK